MPVLRRPRNLLWNPRSTIYWYAIRFLLLLNSDWYCNRQAVALVDDWYGYVSFEDPSTWRKVYSKLCSRNTLDIYREPRTIAKADDLRGHIEASSPIKIDDDDTVKAPRKTTLHIYNSAGIRNAYSLSYGFQRNKECLHGQDEDCIVFPEFGRIRTLVLQAERYKENENLNFIKDHFQIEEPERFVTILNGGSVFERKFYEAVFLGGRKVYEKGRTSHQINGKSYPLEIYMFFVDETVPSVTLSTVLVVLVEESDRDNPHVKPLVTTVENTLYDEERKFLNKHQFWTRQERLFHEVLESTQFDIYDLEGIYSKNQHVFQSTLDKSQAHEPAFAVYVEAYEKMQALEATLFFIDEDQKNVGLSSVTNRNHINDFYARIGNHFFPYNAYPISVGKMNHELHVMAVSATFWPTWRDTNTIINETVQLKDCNSSVNWMLSAPDPSCDPSIDDFCEMKFFGYSVFLVSEGVRKWIPDCDSNPDPNCEDLLQETAAPVKGPHFEILKNITIQVCEVLSEYMVLFAMNRDVKKIKHLSYLGKSDGTELGTVLGKYDLMKQFTDVRKKIEKCDILVKNHFFNKSYHVNAGKWDWRTPTQKDEICSSLVEFLHQGKKRLEYEIVEKNLKAKIELEVEDLHFPDEKIMREVINFLKYGDKGNTAEYRRNTLHAQFVNNFLPSQQKRRGMVELGNMGMGEADIEEAEVRSPLKVIVKQAFQISWLMPHDGGYYYYEGSSPVPPCFRVQNMIVFKKPIKMSKYQIDTLTRIPVSFDRKRDLLSTTPVIWDPYFISKLQSPFTEGSRFVETKVLVYNQSRNQLFLGHDGVHKNAVEEFEELKKKNYASSLMIDRSGSIVMVVCIIMSMLLS